MSHRRTRLGGTTLVELLVAVVFIGICVSAIVSCVTNSGTRATYGKRRILMLGLARSEIEKIKGQGRATALTASSSSLPTAVPGFIGTVTLSKQIQLIAGYTNLFKITVTTTWVEKTSAGNRSDSLTLETWMRSPDA